MSVTAQTVKLTKGARSLDLNSGRYRIGLDFAPPPVSFTSQYAGGSSHNRLGGASLISRKANNRMLAFSINIAASSEAEANRALVDIQTFLNWAGDPSEPVYFEYKGNSDTPEPLWGQYGVNLRYEIVDGAVSFPATYGETDLRARNLVQCPISLTIKPLALGKKQQLASALGGITEDVYGTTDGISRGAIIPGSGVNLFTNPVFGHATYDNGWTAGGTLTVTENTDSKFLLPGQASSAYIVSAGTSDNTYTQVITPGTAGSAQVHTLWSIVKLQGAGTPGTADMQMCWNGTAQTTSFYEMGNGFWYAESAPGTATIGTAGTAGIVIKNGRHVYLNFSQMVQKSHRTMPIWGDLLGCAWTGTAHASTSTRIAARMRITATDVLRQTEGTIRIVVKVHQTNTEITSNVFLWQTTGGMLGSILATNGNFHFNDGTVAISGANRTIARGDKFILHFVWNPSGITLYVNGAVDGTPTTYTNTSLGTYLYLGSSNTVTLPAFVTIMDFATFDMALTATQAANDYASIAQIIADDQRVSPVPWLWTKDGDDVVDNCDDSTRDNWCVCGGIPGNEDAETVIDGTLNNQLSTPGAVWISKFPMRNFYTPTNSLYCESGVTAGTVTDSNSDYTLTTVTTSAAQLNTTFNVTSQIAIDELLNKELYLIARLYDTGANLYIYSGGVYGAGDVIQSNNISVSTTTASRLFRTNPFIIPSKPKEFTDGRTHYGIWVYLYGYRSTGSGDVRCDFFVIMPRPLVKIFSASATDARFVYCGNSAESILGSALNGNLGISGDIIELSPNRFNVLISAISNIAISMTIADTLTYNSIIITPRYALP